MMNEDMKKRALQTALADLKSKATEHSLSPLLSVKISVEGPGEGGDEETDSEDMAEGGEEECPCGEPGCPGCEKSGSPLDKFLKKPSAE